MGSSTPERKTVIVAGGDCSDPSLISGAKDFKDTAARLLGAQLMEPQGVLDILRPRPTRSVEDLERQVESAKALFYGGQGDRALELVERALVELERAPPEARPWPVTQAALVLQALVHKNLEHPKEMNDAFRRIVRLDPTFKLDPDAHPPSAIAALDAVKKELARGRKSPLQVRVDTGPAATVFIDGLAMGAAPLKLELPAGTYRVSLSAPGMLSFPHRVELPRDSKLNVDLAFEGSLGLQAPLCLSGVDDGAAIKLAQLVAAERVIVLRNTARRGGPPFISGSAFDLSTGQMERAGSVAPELMSNLATFVVTGQYLPGVDEVRGTLVAAKSPADVEPAKVELQPAAPASQPRRSQAGRVTSFVLLGVGGASVLIGALTYASGEANRTRLVGITRPDGKLPLYELPVGQEAVALMAKIDGNRMVAFSLIGGGLGALGAGLLGLWLFPSGTTTLEANVSPSGASLQVLGKF